MTVVAYLPKMETLPAAVKNGRRAHISPHHVPAIFLHLRYITLAMGTVVQTLGIGTEQFQIILEVVVAMFLGAIIGWEREKADKPAGLRTHMLVAGAAALFVGLGSLIIPKFAGNLASGAVRSDPIRIFEAIITGVSFLGAGTIIFHRNTERVEGITTAASLLITASIGATIGLAQWFLGVILTFIVFLILNLVGRLKLHSRTPSPAPQHHEEEHKEEREHKEPKKFKTWTPSDVISRRAE